jgi:hypothetical protein
LNIYVLIIPISVIAFFTISNDMIFAQEQNIDEFLEWPSETNYNFVFIVIVIMIALAIMANYLWSKRKGRDFSEE